MTMTDHIESTSDTSCFHNAIIGDGALIEPDVAIGFRFHSQCGLASIGKDCILRKGTLIYGDVAIGDHFYSGHYAVIRARVRIGDYCTVFNHATIEGVVRIGNGVNINTHSYVCSRTWIGDHVFVGPGVTFLNGRFPLREHPTPQPRGATIEDDVMIGGGVTILPGITIGERSFIAAGAVVTKNVPPHSFVIGVPGRVSPLPEHLDMPNDRRSTMRRLDLWHTKGEYPGENDWPEDWPEKFNEVGAS